ncbi:MAG: hypothetical protein RLZZ303_3489 [Candidatus Hydrogenedentota bacterium]|jgi:UDP-N-acetyl-D-mannosaminuronic acid dehydrogenase
MKTIGVLGLGYIGLPTASVLASNGFSVLGVDVDARVVDTVNRGDIHIEEPGLRTLVQAAIQSGNLRASCDPEACDAHIIAVPTPLGAGQAPDLSFVRRATEQVGRVLRKGDLVILESTSPPGTTRDLVAPLLEEATGLVAGRDFAVAYCPERVMPGRILRELIENDRVVGGLSPACAARARDLYAAFVGGQIFLTDATTAEMVKVLENTYRDVNIALANEAALLCEQLGIDYADVGRLANRHPRVNLHTPGPGVGGHCISVDPWFLVHGFPDTAHLIRTARERNNAMPRHVAAQAISWLSDIERPRVALLGAAFKGNVDDIRESPAIEVARLLRDANIEVRQHDPLVRQREDLSISLDDCLDGCDLVVLLTDHAVFREIDPLHAAALVRSKYLYDTRAFLDRARWQSAGFVVHTLGAGESAVARNQS